MRDSQIIEGIVKKYYGFSDVENTKYSIIFHINTPGNEKTFELLLADLDRIGVTAFTNDFPDSQIIVINSSNLGRERAGIKTIMFLISIITLVYAGYSYSSDYYSHISFHGGILDGILLYAVPVLGVLLTREGGKYLYLKKRHIQYRFPIFVPSPGIGTLGTINSNKSQFRESKSMVMAGTVSLLSGFALSIILITLGSITSPFIQYSSLVRSPISYLNFPVIYPVLIDRFIPVSIVPDPLALAGYTGLVTTAINAIPAGFLDGGLVFSGLAGRSFRYISYVSIALLILAAILYPYILILVVLLFLLGIKGALPMNNLVMPGHYAKYLTIIIIIIILLGFAPLPFHNTNNSSVIIPDSYYVIDKQSPDNVSVNITVNEHGSRIIPSFSVHPGKFSIMGHKRDNATAVTYILELITYKSNYSGIKHFNITVNTGTSIFHKTVTVYFLNPVKNISVNNSDEPLTLTKYQNEPFNLTLYNNGTSPVEATLLSFSGNMGVYMMVPSRNTFINLAGDPFTGLTFTISPENNTTMEFEVTTPGIWKLAILESNNMAMIITVHILPRQISPPLPPPINMQTWPGTNETGGTFQFNLTWYYSGTIQENYSEF
ncbi:MAG: hypothetical protein RE471_02285 [Ferroplasma sp.]|uniref:hypothetical protein n=1 Tax=Ferroplasma sp. TaxID=2591003 RepID=UPI002814B9A2|nr:hypothetical protein [Ferroplasma sp.]WMT51722.1 MAG: hypothetical protein RE471_02285 [Ferroplasma sp.]